MHLQFSNLSISLNSLLYIEASTLTLNQVTWTLSRGLRQSPAIMVPNLHSVVFTCVCRVMCAVNESVCTALCRCRNSTGIVVPHAVILGPQTLTFEKRGNYQHSLWTGVAHKLSGTCKEWTTGETEQKITGEMVKEGQIMWQFLMIWWTCLYITHGMWGQILPFRVCLACAFPVFLQLCSLVESLLCSSKAVMWGESTLSEIGTQITADWRSREKHESRTQQNTL